MMIRMFAALLFVLSLAPQAQAGSPFSMLEEQAQVKQVVVLDTAAGKTKVMVMSPSAQPKRVFVFAQGGNGLIKFGAKPNGEPATRAPRNFAYGLGVGFMRAGAAWVVVALPEKYADGISQEDRTKAAHVDVFVKAGEAMKARFPKSKIILIGHSNGGITAAMQAVRKPAAYDAIVLSSPAVDKFPYGWRPEQATVPIMFITHKDDACGVTAHYKVVRLAQGKAPLTTIEAPARGPNDECHRPPAPHFYTGVYGPYQAAVLAWADKV